MRKLLLALGVFAVGVLFYGAVGSGAWFTDTETVPVSATSGGVDIDLRGAAAEGIAIGELLPGDETGPYPLEVFNEGDSDVKYRFTTTDTGGGGLFEHLSVRVSTGNCIGGPTGHDLFPGEVYDGLVADLDLDSSLSVHPTGLPAGITHCWSFVFYLDEDTGGAAENLSTTFDIVVVATQPDNPGWAEATPV